TNRRSSRNAQGKADSHHLRVLCGRREDRLPGRRLRGGRGSHQRRHRPVLPPRELGFAEQLKSTVRVRERICEGGQLVRGWRRYCTTGLTPCRAPSSTPPARP